jgi:hypothetical protein
MKSADPSSPGGSSAERVSSDALEFPPSYEIATEHTPSGATGSSSTEHPQGDYDSERASNVKGNIRFSAGPPNAEPILGKLSTPAYILEQIEGKVKQKKLNTLDARLADRMCPLHSELSLCRTTL